jgi:hypothetical protein
MPDYVLFLFMASAYCVVVEQYRLFLWMCQEENKQMRYLEKYGA